MQIVFKDKKRRCNIFWLDAKCKQAVKKWQHYRAVMVMTVVWVKEQNLVIQNVKWYQEKCNGICFRDLLSKASIRLWHSDLMLEEKQTKTIQICNMACPQENNIEKKRLEKRTNYKQLAFKIREKRPRFELKLCR